MEDAGAGVSTVEHGGMTITSVGSSEAEVRDFKATLTSESTDGDGEKPPAKPPKQTPSDHARELGKRGGKATAEKRAAAAEEGDEKPKAEAKPQERAKAEGEPVEGEDEDLPLSKRAQRRIEHATKKQAEASRALEAERRERAADQARYEARLAALEVNRGSANDGVQARDGAGERRGPERDPDEKPRSDDFENYEEYLDARDSWNRKEWTREQERGQQQAARVKAHVDTVDEFIKAAPKTFRDEIDPELTDTEPFFAMAEGRPLTADNLIVGEALYARARGPAILKYLSDQPDALRYLRSLFRPGDVRGSHENIRVQVQVLSHLLGSKTDATAGDPPVEGDRASKRELSKAPPPVRPVTGAPHIAEGERAPRESEEFDAWAERIHKRSAARR